MVLLLGAIPERRASGDEGSVSGSGEVERLEYDMAIGMSFGFVDAVVYGMTCDRIQRIKIRSWVVNDIVSNALRMS